MNGNTTYNIDDIDSSEKGCCYCLPCCKSKAEKNKEEMFYLSELQICFEEIDDQVGFWAKELNSKCKSLMKKNSSKSKTWQKSFET